MNKKKNIQRRQQKGEQKQHPEEQKANGEQVMKRTFVLKPKSKWDALPFYKKLSGEMSNADAYHERKGETEDVDGPTQKQGQSTLKRQRDILRLI